MLLYMGGEEKKARKQRRKEISRAWLRCPSIPPSLSLSLFLSIPPPLPSSATQAWPQPRPTSLNWAIMPHHAMPWAQPQGPWLKTHDFKLSKLSKTPSERETDRKKTSYIKITAVASTHFSTRHVSWDLCHSETERCASVCVAQDAGVSFCFNEGRTGRWASF